MATLKQPPVPAPMTGVLKRDGVKLKHYKSTSSFEKELLKFINKNHVLHLSTCRKNICRSTPLEYRNHGFTFYILSEGGVKFENLKHNRDICFSIAEPYSSEDDFWGYKGLQAWGKARVISRKENPDDFNAALGKMKIRRVLKKLGMKDIPKEFSYRIIEITPSRIKYNNPRAGVFRIIWEK